jgi:hypothetical protein
VACPVADQLKVFCDDGIVVQWIKALNHNTRARKSQFRNKFTNVLLDGPQIFLYFAFTINVEYSSLILKEIHTLTVRIIGWTVCDKASSISCSCYFFGHIDGNQIWVQWSKRNWFWREDSLFFQKLLNGVIRAR